MSDRLTAAIILGLSLLAIGLAACGNSTNDGGGDAWVCCFNDEDYYACPNKSAQINCENAESFPPNVCDRKPTKDDECQ